MSSLELRIQLYYLFGLTIGMIGIGDMYRCSHRISNCGIQGYQIQKKYEAALKDSNQQNQKKKPTKRGHYLQDYAKIHEHIPPPGAYDYDATPWPKPQKVKKNIKPSKKQTFIEEMVERERKQNRPAPGQYQLFKTEEELKAEKKRLAHRKVSVADRCTYLDAVQYEATTTPGVGSYNTNPPRPKSATQLRSKSAYQGRPDSARRKEKQPEVGTYNPHTLQDHKSFSKKTKGYHEWGRVERFKSQKKNALGPGTYAVDEHIVGKRNGKSVYYN